MKNLLVPATSFAVNNKQHVHILLSYELQLVILSSPKLHTLQLAYIPKSHFIQS